ncbi:MAG: cobaltochelatase subunit CobN [Ectothiorhodospiraceae bacterium]
MLRLILLMFLLAPGVAAAGTVFGVISDRSAPEVAAGAHRFLDNNPDHDVVLRTPEQLARLSDSEVVDLWDDADGVFMAAVFGDQVGRIERLMQNRPPQAGVPVLAMNSDRRITRLSRLGGEALLAPLDDDTVNTLAANPQPGEDPEAHLARLQEEYPDQAAWLEGRAYYQGRSPEHMAGLFRWLLARSGVDIAVPEPSPRQAIRYFRDGEAVGDADELDLDEGPAVALLDLDSGDRPGASALLDMTCDALEERDIQCFAVLARWGGASVEAVSTLAQRAAPADLAGIVSMQDFTVGGGGGRSAVTGALQALDVPVFKGIRLTDRTEAEWRLSEDGVPWDDVHYKLAMPELQGITHPMVLSVSKPPAIDNMTGVRLRLTRPVPERVDAMAARMHHWQRLQTLDNADKRVALVYYNHPPGRQNIGADKLDVQDSLYHMLTNMKAAGYDTGELPDSPEALLDLMQERGVNMPNNAEALDEIAGEVPSISVDEYESYFSELPDTVRAELVNGPVGYLHEQMQRAVDQGESALGRRALEKGVKDLRHMLEEVDHRASGRALDLLDQYQQGWQQRLEGGENADELAELRDALINTGVPGLSGWGEAPGEGMVRDDRMLFPGLRFGNVFIGPQPPRGWEVREELLHANTTFPPTHQYVGFYHWLRDDFDADALVYLGRHSTREFLPRRRAGLAEDDYPDLLGGALPTIYPYIVDGVGEGIQAKRRAMGVMISHLTPPLETTELYDDLLELRQLVETYESASDRDAAAQDRAVERLRRRIREMDLVTELEAELAHDHHGESGGGAEAGAEADDHGDDDEDDREEHRDEAEHDASDEHHDHGDRDDHHEHSEEGVEHPEEAEHHEHADGSGEGDGHDDEESVSLTDVDDDLLVHEVGHYLTEMQERFLPIGLHVFGQDWDDEGIDMMLESMAGDDSEPEPEWREKLAASPGHEMEQFLGALNGRFVPPGQGNDPVRTPEVLPTGRNFHALAGDLIPTRVAWDIGQELAAEARSKGDPEAEGSEAIVLWASDTVRDEGVMVAFGLDMLGVRPKWNSRGIVEGLERMPMEDRERRRDALFTSSGLFRDLYEDQMVWLDQAVRLALDGSSETIRAKHPQLAGALDEALEPLPEDMRDPGDEPLAANDVAANWVADTKALLDQGADAEQAGADAALRVFGTAPGSYGAGVNRLADRSGAWDDRGAVADTYVRRMGHAYGTDRSGGAAQGIFEQRLQSVGRTYLGRASNVYGLLDNDDGFDFQGGLSMAVADRTGEAPDNRVLMHSDPDDPEVQPLARAVLGELRSKNLNPQWLEPLMDRGYAGARTMSADFLDNLWGWQMTSPEVVKSWVWDDVYDVYFQDSHGIGLDEFLEQDNNVHVKTHMQAITLVAAHRGFWDAEPEVIKRQATEFAELVVENGLPGGGHTRPDHPTMDFVAEQLDDAELREAFNGLRAAAKVSRSPQDADPTTITEVNVVADMAQSQSESQQQSEQQARETSEQGAQAEQQDEQADEEQQQNDASEDAESSAEGGVVLLPWLVGGAALLLLAGGVVTGRRL